MGSDGIMGVVLVGLGAGALLAWLRNRAVLVPPPSTSACDALRSVDMRAYNACVVASGAFDVLKAILPTDQLSADSAKKRHDDYVARDASNKSLNGAVDIPVTPAMTNCLGFQTHADSNGGVADVGIGDQPTFPVIAPLQGTVLRFKNGCVPYAGAPGFEKCVPGTQDMFAGNGVITYDNNASDVPKFRFQAVPSTLGTGQLSGKAIKADITNDPNGQFGAWDRDDGMPVQTVVGDPSTGIVKQRLPYCAAATLQASFPLPIQAGGPFGYKAGVPWTCPAGTLPDFAAGSLPNAAVRDHRTQGQGPVSCVPLDGSDAGFAPTNPGFHVDPPPITANTPGATITPGGATVRQH